MISVDKILLANPRGFCAGVNMSIKALVWMARTFPKNKIYCYHEIVHNEVVVNWFEKRGVRFVDDLSFIPSSQDSEVALMLSAHGTCPELEVAARKRFPIVVNSVCPLVSKVHNELRHAELRGSEIVYLGNKEHDEGAGTVAVANLPINVLHPRTWRDDLAQLPELRQKSVTFIAQTTLSQVLYTEVLSALRETADEVLTSEKSDLCFATTHRQDAVMTMAQLCDHVLVVGSIQSANTLSLVDVAMAKCRSVHRVNSVTDIPGSIGGVVGITAGASAPETLVQDILKHIAPKEGVEEFHFASESEYFKLPADLRRLQDIPGVQPCYDIDHDTDFSVDDLMRTL